MEIKSEYELAHVMNIALSKLANQVLNGATEPFQPFKDGATSIVVTLALSDDGVLTVTLYDAKQVKTLQKTVKEQEKTIKEQEATLQTLISPAPEPTDLADEQEEPATYPTTTDDVTQTRQKVRRRRRRS
jgi:hypothetical protein